MLYALMLFEFSFILLEVKRTRTAENSTCQIFYDEFSCIRRFVVVVFSTNSITIIRKNLI